MKTLPREVAQGMNPLERWLKSRKRFWTWGEARMYLPCQTAPDADIVYEEAAHMIRTKDGRYLLNGDEVGLPVPCEFELERCPQ